MVCLNYVSGASSPQKWKEGDEDDDVEAPGSCRHKFEAAHALRGERSLA